MMASLVGKILRSPRTLWNIGHLSCTEFLTNRERANICRGGPVEESALDAKHWSKSLHQPNDFYKLCYRYYHHNLSIDLRTHRKYFTDCFRGFGEDAFHVMWLLLFREFRPSNFLEIGVYRGQTISLIALIADRERHDCTVFGISPFSPSGDSVSTYLTDIDYQQDTLSNFAYFNLPKPQLLRAYSTDESAVALITSRQWDMIYIDGNHDFEIVRSDWQLCSRHLSPGGVIVLDDAGLTTNYQPPRFATRGHPGPSKLAATIDATRFREIMQVGHNRVFVAVAP